MVGVELSSAMANLSFEKSETAAPMVCRAEVVSDCILTDVRRAFHCESCSLAMSSSSCASRLPVMSDASTLIATSSGVELVCPCDCECEVSDAVTS